MNAQTAALVAELKALATEARARADEIRPNDLPPTYLYGLGMGCEDAVDRIGAMLMDEQMN